MDDMMKIHLLIDNERYPMTIRREDEQLYRDAAKQIDNKLNKYRSYYPDFSPARHWAMAALELTGRKTLAVAGGVAANSRIRADFAAAAEKAGAQLFVPPLRLCGDNAAMIGCQGYYEFLAGHTAGPELNAYATMPLEKQIG